MITLFGYFRQVSIDDQGRMITIVYASVPERDFGDVAVIIRNTGAVYTKGPKGERPPMHKWCIRLQELRRLQLFSGSFGSHDASGPCVVCRELGDRVVGDDQLLWSYTVCTGSWHARCASIIDGHAAEQSHPYVCPFCE